MDASWVMRPGRRKFFMRLFACCLLCLGVVPWVAVAGPWLQTPGAWQIIQNLYWYETDTVFDVDGHVLDQSRFTKWEYNPYMEYGVNERLTVGFSPSFQWLESDAIGGGRTKGVADMEVFARTPLYEGTTSILSLQPLVKLYGPYDTKDNPRLGNGQLDAELRLLWGKSLRFWEQYHFISVETAYRHRMEAPGDQVRLDATLGYRSSETKMWLSQLFYTRALTRPEVTSGLATTSENFDLLKAQFSLVHHFTEDIALQTGAFTHVMGRNTGAGSGLMLALWWSF